MSAFIDRPTRKGWRASSAGSSAIRTGRRCTTLVQLPVAFWAEPGLGETGLGGRHLGVVADARAADRDAGGVLLAGRRGLAGLCLGHGGLSGSHGSLGLVEAVLGGGQLVAGNGACGGQSLATRQVGAGPLEVGPGAVSLSAGAGDVSAAGRGDRG